MSKTLLELLTAELTTFRVRCLNPRCGAVVEAAADQIGRVFVAYECPVCHAPFRAAGAAGAGNPLAALEQALKELAASATFKASFVVEQPPSP